MGGAVAAYVAGRRLESLLAGGRPDAETSPPIPRSLLTALAGSLLSVLRLQWHPRPNRVQAVQAIASRKPTATIQ